MGEATRIAWGCGYGGIGRHSRLEDLGSMRKAQFAGSQLGPSRAFVFFFMPPRDTAENAPLLTNHYHFHLFYLYSYVLLGLYPCSFDDS
jgi:hypothetical protein